MQSNGAKLGKQIIGRLDMIYIQFSSRKHFYILLLFKDVTLRLATCVYPRQ